MALWKPKGQSNRENKRYLNEVTILRLLDKIGVRRQEKSSVGNKNYPPYRLRKDGRTVAKRDGFRNENTSPRVDGRCMRAPNHRLNLSSLRAVGDPETVD